MCDLCEYDKDDMFNNFFNVCNGCFRSIPSKLITKTNAIKDYPITEKDVKNIRHLVYKTTYTTYLYSIEDIEYYCIKKYKSRKGFRKQQAIKVKRKEDRKKELEDRRNTNRDILNKYLQSIGLMGVREDSELCKVYIERADKSGYSLEDIGSILKEMEFFHKYTDYNKTLRKERRKARIKNREYGYHFNWNEEDEEELRIKVKKITLRNYLSKNLDDTQKIMLEIPLSLKAEADKIYNKLTSKNNLEK